jgi:hypothetical protein
MTVCLAFLFGNLFRVLSPRMTMLHGRSSRHRSMPQGASSHAVQRMNMRTFNARHSAMPGVPAGKPTGDAVAG